jgi:hypothetical protein
LNICSVNNLNAEIMNIRINKNTESFFGLSTLIPGIIWFLAGYISHIEANNIPTLPSISIAAFICLLASVNVALFLIKMKSSKTPLENQIRYKNQTSNWQNEKHLTEIVQKLENHMKVNEPFMDSSLSIYDLAKSLMIYPFGYSPFHTEKIDQNIHRYGRFNY